MDTITPEEANEWIRRFIADGDPQEQRPNPEESVPWEEKRPLSWADFLAILVRYCHHRQWQIIFDSPDDLSLAIFAHNGQGENGAEALQGRLPFGDDSLDSVPFTNEHSVV